MTQPPAPFHHPSLSYEVFPPNTQVGAERLTHTLNDLAEGGQSRSEHPAYPDHRPPASYVPEQGARGG